MKVNDEIVIGIYALLLNKFLAKNLSATKMCRITESSKKKIKCRVRINIRPPNALFILYQSSEYIANYLRFSEILSVKNTQKRRNVNPYHAEFQKLNNPPYIFGTIHYHFYGYLDEEPGQTARNESFLCHNYFLYPIFYQRK